MGPKLSFPESRRHDDPGEPIESTNTMKIVLIVSNQSWKEFGGKNLSWTIPAMYPSTSSSFPRWATVSARQCMTRAMRATWKLNASLATPQSAKPSTRRATKSIPCSNFLSSSFIPRFCTTVHDEECRISYETNYKTVYDKKCSTTYVKSCHDVSVGWTS